MSSSLLDRFLRYVKVGTTANEKATTYPSSPGQLVLGKMLTDELRALGLKDAEQDGHGIVLATLPATVQHAAPAIARASSTALTHSAGRSCGKLCPARSKTRCWCGPVNFWA